MIRQTTKPTRTDTIFTYTTSFRYALKLETAKQGCVGVVLQPQFLRGFALSVDYYDIKIKGAIGSVDAQTIVDRCAEGVQAFCSAVVRGPNDFGNNLPVLDRKSVVYGKSVSVRVDLGGRRSMKKTHKINREATNRK